jgi:hypothetical protein
MPDLSNCRCLLVEREKDTATKHFEVTVFERYSEVPGIRNLTSPTTDLFQTPMYEGLETNAPRTLMTYKDFPYPKDVSIFPTCDKIKQYLESYADDIRDCIKLNSEVIGAVKVMKDYQPKWKVYAENKVRGANVQAEHLFDVNRFSRVSLTVDGKGNYGKQSPEFDAYLVWIRENLAKMRDAFVKRGDKRHDFTSLESLGV